MSISRMLEPIGRERGPITLSGAEKWRQGRTMYGGASALIAFVAARRAHPDLPPPRAAQVAFIAPVGETIELETEMVRAGRNVTQVRSVIRSEGSVALTALFLFGAAREPNALHPSAAIENPPRPPEEAEPVMEGKGPDFLANNFELRRAQETRGPGKPVVRRWVRLKDESALDPAEQLFLLGDTLPPGAMRAMRRPGPISSMNWSFNILDPAPQTRDGWWLLETESSFADEGYSSERLRLWNADGKQVLDGIQAVAIFG